MGDLSTRGGFKLSITGQVDYIELPDADQQIHCHIEFVIGTDWKIIGGLESVLSQTMLKGRNPKFIANLPLELLLESTNMFGWPQIVISCFNNEKCMGVGRIHIPIKIGFHQDLKVSLAKPLPSSSLAEILNKRPILRDTKLLTNPNAFQLLRMESCGVCSISVSTTAQGLRALGYDIGCELQQ